MASHEPRPVLIGTAAGLAALAAIAGALVGPAAAPERPITAARWQRAHRRIDERLAAWSRRGWFPEEARAAFGDAWRLELAGNRHDAAVRWEALASWLLALPAPGGAAGGPTMAEAAGSGRAMRVVMARDRRARSTGFALESDQAYAEALVSFVRARAELARLEKAGAGR